jgi:transposase InsO family protein
LSVEKVATEGGLHETVLRRWVKQFSVQATGTMSRRAAANRALLEDIRRTHAESSGTYGSPRVHAALRRRGRRIGRPRIERLMRHAVRGLAALPRRTRATDSRHTYPIAPNRLGRNFVASRPGQIWLAEKGRVRPEIGEDQGNHAIERHLRRTQISSPSRLATAAA